MINFAEELVYWYLRLNGFFPMSNFVLHSQGLTSNQSADADLLGVRPKFVTEEIGENHLDSKLFKHFSMPSNIGVICEVKSGEIRPGDVKMTREDRLEYALKRLGFFSEAKVAHHLEGLKHNKVIHGKFHSVGKVLFTNLQHDQPDCICLNLQHVENFIMRRIELYPHEKSGAKHFFGSNLFQYMIWKTSR